MAVLPGQAFGFLGRNGAGKTTTVKVLLGLARSTAGSASIFGAPAGSLAARRQVGYLPEMFRYQHWMRGGEVAKLHCRLAGIPRADWDRAVEQSATTVGLQSRLGDRVGTYSKGMQQRLGIGLALLGNPPLVILDEPTSALDPVGRHDVRNIIHALTSAGTTVFLNSHMLSEVERVCDRVAIVESGKVLATGTLDELVQGQTAVRVNLKAPTAEHLRIMSAAGALTTDTDGSFVIVGVSDGAISALVTALAAKGAAIRAVQPVQHDLEERFLELVSASTKL